MSTNTNFLSNVRDDCEMKLITQKVINFIDNYAPLNAKFIDLTWFNHYDETINSLDDSVIFAVDVADPPYFLEQKLEWLKKHEGRVIYVGPIAENIPCPIIITSKRDDVRTCFFSLMDIKSRKIARRPREAAKYLCTTSGIILSISTGESGYNCSAIAIS